MHVKRAGRLDFGRGCERGWASLYLLNLYRVRLNSGKPVALFKNQTIRLAVLALAVFKVVSTVAIAQWHLL